MMRRLRYLLRYPLTWWALNDLRTEVRAMSPEARAAAISRARAHRTQGITAAFNPHNGVVEELPFITKTSLSGSMSGGNNATGYAIAYLRWVLYAYCTYTSLRPAVNWGPWTYSPCAQGVYNTRVFFGLSGSYTCSEANGTWDLIDLIWGLNN